MNSIIHSTLSTIELVGGYADTPWGEKQNKSGPQRSGGFFGGGRAFLFASEPEMTKEEREELSFGRTFMDSLYFFKWTGENEYSQICDRENGSFGMGGGGEFGWFVQRDFTIGSSGRCNTFRNPPLVTDDCHHFDVTDLEGSNYSMLLLLYVFPIVRRS